MDRNHRTHTTAPNKLIYPPAYFMAASPTAYVFKVVSLPRPSPSEQYGKQNPGTRTLLPGTISRSNPDPNDVQSAGLSAGAVRSSARQYICYVHFVYTDVYTQNMIYNPCKQPLTRCNLVLRRRVWPDTQVGLSVSRRFKRCSCSKWRARWCRPAWPQRRCRRWGACTRGRVPCWWAGCSSRGAGRRV